MLLKQKEKKIIEIYEKMANFRLKIIEFLPGRPDRWICLLAQPFFSLPNEQAPQISQSEAIRPALNGTKTKYSWWRA